MGRSWDDLGGLGPERTWKSGRCLADLRLEVGSNSGRRPADLASISGQIRGRTRVECRVEIGSTVEFGSNSVEFASNLTRCGVQADPRRVQVESGSTSDSRLESRPMSGRISASPARARGVLPGRGAPPRALARRRPREARRGRGRRPCGAPGPPSATPRCRRPRRRRRARAGRTRGRGARAGAQRRERRPVRRPLQRLDADRFVGQISIGFGPTLWFVTRAVAIDLTARLRCSGSSLKHDSARSLLSARRVQSK